MAALWRRSGPHADAHITTLTATVLTENGPARRLAKSLARPQLVELDGPETHFTYRVAS